MGHFGLCQLIVEQMSKLDVSTFAICHRRKVDGVDDPRPLAQRISSIRHKMPNESSMIDDMSSSGRCTWREPDGKIGSSRFSLIRSVLAQASSESLIDFDSRKTTASMAWCYLDTNKIIK